MTTCEKDTEALIARSPLGYSLYDGRTDERHPARTTVEPAGSSDNSIDTSDPDNSKNAIEGTSPKQFVVHIFRKRGTKSISELIDFDPLHGPWPTKKPDATSFIAKTLRKSIPDPILRVGLSDWETSGQLLDDQDGLDVDTGGARNPKKGREYYVQRRMDRREARERAAEAVDILNDSDLIAQKDSRPETARNTHQHTSHHHHHRHRIEP
jgi:hypothetical protein